MVGESKVLCPWCLKGEVYVEGYAGLRTAVSNYSKKRKMSGRRKDRC